MAVVTGPRHSTHGLYRPDVDGLRCVAVLGVIFCHLKFSSVSGGFVGVDVFFVISGYLISRNILNDLRDGSFSLLRFYDRRIRRIFPALFTVIAASFAVGLVLYSPEHLRVLAGDVVSSLFSIVNIRFWKGAHDYFAASSDERTLLHLWSLSVEEQFYLVWPGLLLLITRSKNSAFRFVSIAILAAVSLIAAQLWLPRDPAAAFYLTPFRVFEFAFGTMVVLAERRGSPAPGPAAAMVAAGLFLIFATMVIYTPETPFPGLTAAIPAAGTALAIYGGGRASSRILGNPAAVWVGTISYSLYLCHWPVVVFGRHVVGDLMDVLWVKLLALAVIFGLAMALYRLVEVPFRSRAPVEGQFWKLLGASGVAIALVAVPAHTAFRQDGWSWRFPESQQEIMRKQAFAIAPCSDYRCVFGNTAGPLGVQIIGDSYAQQYVAALQPLLLRQGLRGESYAYGGCLMLDGIRLGNASTATQCAAERDAAFGKIRSSGAPILIAQAWTSYRGGLAGEDGRMLPVKTDEQHRETIVAALSRTLDLIGGAGRHVLLIGGEVRTNCKKYETEIRRLSIVPPLDCSAPTLAEVQALTAPWNEIFRKMQAQRPDRIETLFPEDYLCTDVCNVIHAGLWLFRDSGHLTVMGSELVGRRAEESLVGFLQRKPTQSGLAVDRSQ